MPRPKFHSWPRELKIAAPAKIIEAYQNGFAGAYDDPEERGKFDDWICRAGGGYVSASEVAHNLDFAGAGEGQLILPFVNVLDLFPTAIPGAAQRRGDCFPHGTMVRMADGSERPIEQVGVGEQVISHNGAPCRVTRVIEKEYAGQIATLTVDGYAHKITATPDHRFIVYPLLWNTAIRNTDSRWRHRSEVRDWKAIGDLQPGDYVSLPRVECDQQSQEFDLSEMPGAFTDNGPSGRCLTPSTGMVRSRNSKADCKQKVAFDERLSWMVGLFLAEGSIDLNDNGEAKRISFSLARDEVLLAEQVRQYAQDLFGVEAKFNRMKSKPSVLMVRISGRPIAELFSLLAGGNVYTKRVPWQVFSASRAVRLAMLRGWMDGDGNLGLTKRTGKQSKWYRCKLTGVSVSHDLCRGMFDLANSCGLRATLTKRKPRGRSRAASDLHLYGEQALAIYPDRRTECHAIRLANRHHAITAHGIAAKVKSVEIAPFTGKVYCLEVERDQSFLAEGFAVHNCVSHSTIYAALLTACCEIARGKPDEVTGHVEGAPQVTAGGADDAVFSSESVYWWRDHGGDGWSCDHAARVVCTESGLWLRKPYPEFNLDLTRYSAQTAGKWGAKNPPAEIKAFGQSHLVRVATRIDGFESFRDFTAMGVGITSCGGEGWSNKRNEHGVSKRSGSWAHAFVGNLGVDDRPWAHQTYGEPLVAPSNSWGTWNSGPRDIHDSAGMVPAAKKADWIAKGIVNPETGNIMLPHGAWWTTWSSFKRRSMIALGGVAGWPRSPIDNLLI